MQFPTPFSSDKEDQKSDDRSITEQSTEENPVEKEEEEASSLEEPFLKTEETEPSSLPEPMGEPDFQEEQPPLKHKKKKKKASGMTAIVLILSIVFAAILAGAGLFIITHSDYFVKLFPNLSEDGDNPPASMPADPHYHISDWVNPGDLRDDEAFVNVAAKCSPSVVAITVKTAKGTSAGSGVIWTDDGYIVTNYHVIDDARSVEVTLSNNDIHRAVVVGGDPKNDLAVIRIHATGLYPASVGKYESLKVGQSVVVIGNPLGALAGTVSEGILSALARDIRVAGTVINVMQTTAAINPGNSGGGCFDIDGNLIGIVNAKASEAGIEGLGFAIPIHKVVEVVEKIVQGDHSTLKNSIGVSSSLYVTKENYNELSEQQNFIRLVTKANGNQPLYGIYVIADDFVNYIGKDHMKNGDVIVGIDGKSFQNQEQFNEILSSYQAGDPITLQLFRLEQNQNSLFGGSSKLISLQVKVHVVQLYR